MKLAWLGLGVASLLYAGQAAPQSHTTLPESVQQGSLVFGQTQPGSAVQLQGKPLRVAADGRFVFGIGRDAARDARVDVILPDGQHERIQVAVKKRDWPIERVSGVPPATVDPPPEIAARIAREQAAVAAQRGRDESKEEHRYKRVCTRHGSFYPPRA